MTAHFHKNSKTPPQRIFSHHSSEMNQVGGEQYERLSHRDQIRLRPDTYIGSPAGVTGESIWYAEIDKNWKPPIVVQEPIQDPTAQNTNVLAAPIIAPVSVFANIPSVMGAMAGPIVPDRVVPKRIIANPPIKITNPSTQIAAAIIGISKEVFDNATDNAERSRVEGIDPGIIEVEMTQNSMSLKNYGKHIPIVIHHKEGIWVPQMIFGVLLTSDNYDDSIARYKIGRNGYGIKLTNVFSIIFKIIVGDPVNKLKYTQVWQNGMLHVSEPIIERYDGPGFTQVIFVPDFPYFYEMNLGNMQQSDVAGLGFLDSMQGYFLSKTMGMSYAAGLPCKFNGIEFDYTDIEKYFECHMPNKDPLRKQIRWTSQDKNDEFIIADTPGVGFQVAFVNGTPVHQGEHVNEYLRVIFEDLCTNFENIHKKKVTVVHLKKHVSMVLRCKLDKPAFDSQIKKRLVKPKPKVVLPKKIQKDVMKWELEEELKKIFNVKTKKAVERQKQKTRVMKVNDAVMAGVPGESHKCTLILTEGETGCTLALKGNKYLPGGMQYNGVYPLKGKIMNIDRHNQDKVDANKELNDIMEILRADRNVDYSIAENFAKLRYGKICFMCDADDDGQHIQGLGINFILTYLRSIAPFNFTLSLLTPIVDVRNIRSNQLLSFYYHKQFLTWQKNLLAAGGNLVEWEMSYKKGLGSWNTEDPILEKLFKVPAIITYCVDSETDDVLNLVFNKKMTNERKQWISAYDPNSQAVYVNPRPVTDFFQEEFRSFSKMSVIRAIPRLMDGMKPVHRKVLYAMFLKFSRTGKHKMIKIPQFAGFVMEKSQYHYGQEALFETITIMGQRYLTGPNNLPLVLGEGNFGDRRQRGKDASPARYLKCGLHPIAYYVYRQEDWPLLKIQYDEGEPMEPEEMYPVIPMAIVNKTEGIGTGWSTKIPPHNPLIVIQWVIAWVQEMKTKRHIPKNELTIDVSSKPDLIPYWKGYRGEIRRIANKPHEKFLNLGEFKEQMHTVYVTELPAETSIDTYKLWLAKEEQVYEETPEKAILRTFDMHVEPPLVDFRINGMFGATLEKLRLVKTISMSNMTLIDKDNIPRKFDYIYEILCTWCTDRLEIYEKRRLYKVGELEDRHRKTTLKYLFIMDVVEERLILKNRQKSEYIPYMKAKGYPCNKDKDGDDFTLMPLKSITRERLIKLRKEIGDIERDIEYYKTVWAEDLWLKDLEELNTEVIKLYR